MTEKLQRVALVTGAAKRIGRSIALALAERGWDIVVHYGHSAEEAAVTVQDIQRIGRHAVAVQCDLNDEPAVKTLMARAAQALDCDISAIRCVVNNASLFDYDNVNDFSFDRLDKHMHANLAAPILLAQALHAITPQGSQSVVINLLDQKLYNLNPDFLSYTLSKISLQGAITLLAQALAPTVRVVGVAPGITLISGIQTDDEFSHAHTQTALGRSSTPPDIAAAVCFAADATAMTGTTLLIDGGQHLIPLSRDVMFVAK